jgi:ectoine hydroxylase
MKDRRAGGAGTCHQDYGYWFPIGVLGPRFTRVSVAVDGGRRDDGCLRVIPRSHELGRIEHVLSGDGAGADQNCVRAVLERLPLVYCETEPRDAIFPP